MKKRVSEEKLKRLVRTMPALPDDPGPPLAEHDTPPARLLRSLLVLFFAIVVVCWVLWWLPLE